MVISGELSPDPSNQPGENNLNLETPNLFMPVVASSDSEDDDMSHEGYEMLPQDVNEGYHQDPEESEEDEDVEKNDEIIIPDNNIPPVSTFDEAFRSEVTELWSSGQGDRQTNIEMDSAKEELVRNAMANFSLPLSAIPPWAKHIPEEEWKQQLISQINLKK